MIPPKKAIKRSVNQSLLDRALLILWSKSVRVLVKNPRFCKISDPAFNPVKGIFKGHCFR